MDELEAMHKVVSAYEGIQSKRKEPLVELGEINGVQRNFAYNPQAGYMLKAEDAYYQVEAVKRDSGSQVKVIDKNLNIEIYIVVHGVSRKSPATMNYYDKHTGKMTTQVNFHEMKHITAKLLTEFINAQNEYGKTRNARLAKLVKLIVNL